MPRNETLFAESLAIRWRVDSAGRVAVEEKDVARGRLGRSPDTFDAVLVAMFAVERPGAAPRNQQPLYWG